VGADGADIRTRRIIEITAEDEPEDENDNEEYTLSRFRKNAIKRAENLLVIMANVTKELHIPYSALLSKYTETAIYDIWHSILLAKGKDIRSHTKKLRDEGFSAEDEKRASDIALEV